MCIVRGAFNVVDRSGNRKQNWGNIKASASDRNSEEMNGYIEVQLFVPDLFLRMAGSGRRRCRVSID